MSRQNLISFLRWSIDCRSHKIPRYTFTIYFSRCGCEGKAKGDKEAELIEEYQGIQRASVAINPMLTMIISKRIEIRQLAGGELSLPAFTYIIIVMMIMTLLWNGISLRLYIYELCARARENETNLLHLKSSTFLLYSSFFFLHLTRLLLHLVIYDDEPGSLARESCIYFHYKQHIKKSYVCNINKQGNRN